MAGDCTHIKPRCAGASGSKAWPDRHGEGPGGMDSDGGYPTERGCSARWSPNFEMIDGLLYRKKLEKGYVNYREVLKEDRRLEAISTFHRRRLGQRHLSLEETYKSVAENYWWEGMYFQIRDFVLSCTDCQSQSSKKSKAFDGRRRVTKTMPSHGADVLSKLRSQREAGLFCDITLQTNGQSFSAHRAVLAAVSDHFQELFNEMDLSKKADIDLTGFSEDGLLSLLDFSYSSTLCVRQEDLPEVCAMARHLGMWPAVEACSALLKEQEQQFHPGKAFASACSGSCCERHHQRRGEVLELDSMNESFSLTLDTSEESLHESPRRNLRHMPKNQDQNGLPLSPSHRMKLMDFKSPSSKKASTPRHGVATSQSYSPMSPSNTRLLRSSPKAAKEVQRWLPMPETPRRNKRSHSIAQLSCSPRSRPGIACSPVRVKQEVQEVGEDEEDYERAQEKYKLMNVLGLQRTALLPRPEDLIGWRQKKRLRKLKANNYSLTKRRKPRSTSPGLSYKDMTLSLPLCNPVNTRLLSKCANAKPLGSAGTKQQIPVKRRKTAQLVPPTDRSMRSKGVLPDLFQHTSRPAFVGRELRRSVRKGDAARRHSQQSLRRSSKKSLVRNTPRIKAEPVEHSVSDVRLSSNCCCDNKPSMSVPSPRTQLRNRVAVDTVKTLRYNRSRPVTKAKLRRGFTNEVDKTKCKSREDGRKGLKRVPGTGPKVKKTEPNGLQFSERAPPPSIYNHPLYRAIKEEPAEPVPVAPFLDPPSPDLGKRQSKPPIKLLDSGFLFNFCRPAGGAMATLKKEEESVDICLTRSVSQVEGTFESEESPHRTLRARGPPVLPVKRERAERNVTQGAAQRPRLKSQRPTLHLDKCAASKTTQTLPKRQSKVVALSSRSCVLLDAVQRARLRQLRGPRSQAPKGPKATHSCLQCSATYKDCDALTMHQLRHVDGKHWPCPLCSKTFFRLRNVRNHIRTHDPKLYKCRSCIAAAS
uniref:Si:dkey-229b18.3 n=1 Tax=Nothobranchius kadleci TaxID=1051664 RepID=A0A1A8DHD4_NOTKA